MGKKYNEMIIFKNGKINYVVTMEDRKTNKSSRTPYIEIYNGEIRFSESYYSDINVFDLNDEIHRIAKGTFMTQLRACIRERINDLKILEEVFTELNLSEHLGIFITGENVKELKQLDERHIEEVEAEYDR